VEHKAGAGAVAEDDRLPLLRAQTQRHQPHPLHLRKERLHPQELVVQAMDGKHKTALNSLPQQRQPRVHQEILRIGQVSQHQKRDHRLRPRPHLEGQVGQARNHRQRNLHAHLRTPPLSNTKRKKDGTVQKGIRSSRRGPGLGLHQDDKGILRELLQHRFAVEIGRALRFRHGVCLHYQNTILV